MNDIAGPTATVPDHVVDPVLDAVERLAGLTPPTTLFG
jgi:hypothetical protein